MKEEWAAWFADKQFSVDWTAGNYKVWEDCLGAERQKYRRILEIGSWEGRSAIFFLEFFSNSTITCIDTFAGSPEHEGLLEEIPQIEARFDANLSSYGDRVTKIKGPSAIGLTELAARGERFDLIYIDGAHDRASVMIDSLLSWQLLNDDGVAIWDDYVWGRGEVPGEDRPEQAIYLFVAMERNRLEILHRKVQLIVRKTATRQSKPSAREQIVRLALKCLMLPHHFGAS